MPPADGGPGTRRRTVLHVADVAGVATALVDALDAHGTWQAEQVALPDWGVGRGAARHAIGRVIRASQIPGRVRRAADASGASLIHLHWARFAPLLVRQDYPLVVHVHGSDVRDRTGRAAEAVQKAMARATAVLVSTPDLVEHVRTPSTYLPNPVDTDQFVPTESTTNHDDGPTILLFARLSDVKGAPILIEAARQIRKRDPGIRVLGVSGGEHDSTASSAGVELLAPMDRTGVVGLLHRADVVVGQQAVGTLGLSELEAMSCAKPVIVPLRSDLYASEVPVERAYEPSEIAEAALRLVQSRHEAQSLGRSGRDYVVAHHSHGSVAAQLSALYEMWTDG